MKQISFCIDIYTNSKPFLYIWVNTHTYITYIGAAWKAAGFPTLWAGERAAVRLGVDSLNI